MQPDWTGIHQVACGSLAGAWAQPINLALIGYTQHRGWGIPCLLNIKKQVVSTSNLKEFQQVLSNKNDLRPVPQAHTQMSSASY